MQYLSGFTYYLSIIRLKEVQRHITEVTDCNITYRFRTKIDRCA
jgi:hypothetical protein